MDADSDTDSEPDFGMMDNATVDSRVRQDDYQQLTGSRRIGGDIAPLMGSRGFDVVYVWPNSRSGVDFNALLRCLPATNAYTVILRCLPCPLSVMQRMIFGIIHTHAFGASQKASNYLSSSSVRPGPAKSYLISANRQLFTYHTAASSLKMNAPTRTQVAVANVHHGHNAVPPQTIQFIQRDLK